MRQTMHAPLNNPAKPVVFPSLEVVLHTIKTHGPFIDTRPRSAFVAGHIPGSISIPAEEFPAQLHTLPPAPAHLALVGASPPDNTTAALLTAAGYKLVAVPAALLELPLAPPGFSIDPNETESPLPVTDFTKFLAVQGYWTTGFPHRTQPNAWTTPAQVTYQWIEPSDPLFSGLEALRMTALVWSVGRNKEKRLRAEDKLPSDRVRHLVATVPAGSNDRLEVPGVKGTDPTVVGDARVVGIVSVISRPTVEDGAHSGDGIVEAQLFQMAVSPDVRGTGVGKELIDRVKDMAASDFKADVLFAHCRDYALNFYRAIGFSVGEANMCINLPHHYARLALTDAGKTALASFTEQPAVEFSFQAYNPV